MASDFQNQIEEMSNEIKKHLNVDKQGKVIETPKNEFSSNINGLRIYLNEIVKSNPQLEDYSPKYAKEILDNMQTILELSRFIDSDVVRASQKKEDAIVSETPEQMKRYKKLREAYTFIPLKSDQLKYFKHKITDKGIPYNELISSTGGKCLIVTKGVYADQVRLCARAASASSRSGQISLGTIQAENTLQISGLSAVEKGFYEVNIRDRNLEFAAKSEDAPPEQLSYANALTSKDPSDITYSVIFRRADAAEHLKAAVRAVGAANCLTSKKGNAYLGNIIMAEEKERLAIEGALQKSAYSDVYLCADSADLYMKLTQNGLEIYSRDADSDEVVLKQTASRTDKDFLAVFNESLNVLKSCGVKVILDSETKGINMQNTKERKALLAQRKTQRLSIPTIDENFMKQLKSATGKDFKTLADFKKALQEYPKTDLFNNVVLEMMCSTIDRQSELLRENPKMMSLDILFNKNDKPNIIQLMQSYSEYAKQYASFMEIKAKIDLYQEDPTKYQATFPGEGVPTTEASSNALEKLTLMGEALKQEIETMRAEYSIPDSEMDVFKNSVATMCGATFDAVTGEIVFSNNLEEVEKSCAGLENATNELMALHQNMSRKVPMPSQSLEQTINQHKENMQSIGHAELNERDEAARSTSVPIIE